MCKHNDYDGDAVQHDFCEDGDFCCKTWLKWIQLLRNQTLGPFVENVLDVLFNMFLISDALFNVAWIEMKLLLLPQQLLKASMKETAIC